MKATVLYTCDYSDGDGDQNGRITIKPESGGEAFATWSATGGMGDGCELRGNSTLLSCDDLERILDTPDLCQGIGEYEVEISLTEGEWPTIELIRWLDR